MSKTLAAFIPALFLSVLITLLALGAPAQDASTGAIRGYVEDPSGARIAKAAITLTNSATGGEQRAVTDEQGAFWFQMLAPGNYVLKGEAAGMIGRPQMMRVDLGAEREVALKLAMAGTKEMVEVRAETSAVETQPSGVSAHIDEQAINDLPLNGRRFGDLILLTPGVTQDPRGLTSASNGDMAVGGIRGWQTSYLVDGTDNNNSFFAQARGRYRAPYQFSNEVVQEFRVSSNSYGPEQGRAGSGVVNVVTKSGSNNFHGSGFYYLRDSDFGARPAFLDFKPEDRQNQFGATLGGPIKKNKVFFYAGFDQHLFHVPTIVYFLTGSPTLSPSPADYEASDKNLVMLTAQSLSTLGGQFRSDLEGNAGFAKVDVNLSPRNFLTARVSTSRYYGTNNVFFDPASPITTYATSENGEEDVATETSAVSLTSGLTPRMTSHLRVQFSRDLQDSAPNATYPLTRIRTVIDGFGRSNILPRQTREHRLQLAETLSLEGRRHSLKVGGDVLATWIYNFFPSLFQGEYIFDTISVNPWTFQPQTYGMSITPLRAYAHQVPRYYVQNFGTAVSHPDTNEYAGFVQDTIRLTDRLGLSLGVRYDYQTFLTSSLQANSYWPSAGKIPDDSNNFAPRIGLSYALGDRRPLMIRAGYGWFYTRIPSIYASEVETDNGLRSSNLILDNSKFADQQVFPAYPNPLGFCATNAASCVAPASVAGMTTSEISAFANNFVTPMVQQASLSVEREIAEHTVITTSYLYVHGEHLIRARDANLPTPVQLSYPVFDDATDTFTGQYYTVDSFANWQMTKSLSCPFPPCINDVARPIPQVGSINEFDSAASSVYNALSVQLRRRMSRGVSFTLAYTWAHAMDDGQDALVAGRPATVQNAAAPNAERGLSSIDQRQRLATSWTWAPQPFHREHDNLRLLFNDWKIAGILSIGSGRPVNAQVTGDANQDGNSSNDRLPGYRRNAFLGPDYASTDVRLTRMVPIGDHLRLNFIAESFNVFNRDNKRMDITDDGFANSAAAFVQELKTLGSTQYPAYFRTSAGALQPTSSYAPRQVQLAVKLTF